MRQEESIDGREEGIICQDEEGIMSLDEEDMQIFIEEQASDSQLLLWQMHYQISPKFKDQVDNAYSKSDLAITLEQQGEEALQILQNNSKYIPTSNQIDTMWDKINQKIKNK